MTDNNDKEVINDFILKYKDIWYDFVLIRYNVLYGDLKNLFIQLGCNMNDINKFFSYCKFYRNQAILLPINRTNIFSDTFDEYKNIISDFSCYSKNNSSKSFILTYFLIYNAMQHFINAGIFKIGRKYFGFEHIIGQELELLGKENKILTKENIILKFKHFILARLCQTNIFGIYVSDTREFYGMGVFGTELKKLSKMNEIPLANCKKNLFSNKLSELEFDQFINQCINSDINNISNISNYKINENTYCTDNIHDFGFGNLILNRMSFIIFHDLSIMLENTNENKHNMFYPSLDKMYSLLYNFSIYCHCYPFQNKNESFYLSQYFDFRNKTFPNQLNFKIELSDFNYFYGGIYIDGTLLHKACSMRYNNYCDILINKGNFDFLKYSPHHQSKRMTPLQLAKQANNAVVLALIQVT